MSTWAAFVAEQPDLAREVRARLDANVHKVMATLRADGSPRLCGTEVVFHGDDLWLAGMVGARRFADLRRDPRVALHSAPHDAEGWDGDARLAGTAHASDDAEVRAAIAGTAPESAPDPTAFELFRVDVTEVVSIRLEQGADGLVVEAWHEGRGVRRRERG
ncbi:pyridoxamine 5'-phosphate oxidase family protein [Aquipuribacter nitratireducens]|uniref:Pyridoxamine 5'-phosphate oxidase family protein n=1 Tax=Aquipuribacter nitratireducens TaxID=650104 RepID=A0ABW0GJE9_9MICO